MVTDIYTILLSNGVTTSSGSSGNNGGNWQGGYDNGLGPSPMVLDLLLNTFGITNLFWSPPKYDLTVMNKGSIGGDINFVFEIVSKDNQTSLFRDQLTIFISGMDQKIIDIPIPQLPEGSYKVFALATSPVTASASKDLVVTSPFWGSIWCTLIIVGVIVALVLMSRKRRR